jgi:hypothetical protein
MNLKHLTDNQLKLDTQNLVQNERSLLTQILYHLKEIESRKLYSSFGYSSLFDYTCRELKYSSDQAYRRIQAMRLLKDMPEVVQKIDSGELSLSNITQAQKYFKEANVTSKVEKIVVLKKLIHKSVREGQKEILKLLPEKPLPQESVKQITSTYKSVTFNMSDELQNKLEGIKTLLGPKAYDLSMSDLISEVADLAKLKLLENKFGSKNIKTDSSNKEKENIDKLKDKLNKVAEVSHGGIDSVAVYPDITLNVQSEIPLEFEDQIKYVSKIQIESQIKTNFVNSNRYISKQLKYHIWQKDMCQCSKCSSKFNLQIDHRKPLGLGGGGEPANLRLLCFNCNQRSRIEAKL